MVETEEIFTYAEFRDAFAKQIQLVRGRRVGKLTILGVLDDGSGSAAKLRFFWEDEKGDRHFGAVSNLTSKPITVSFSQVTDGVGATPGGTYELITITGILKGGRFVVPQQSSATKVDGFSFRKNSDQLLYNAMKFTSGGNITLGDPIAVLQMAGIKVLNGGIAWNNLALDTTIDAGGVLGGLGVDQSALTNPRYTSQDSGSVLRKKSIPILWETGSFTGNAINNAYAQVFTNAQKDANYFVVIETDDGNAATATQNSDVTSKTAAGFTVEFPAILPVNVTVRWYAVRYGV